MAAATSSIIPGAVRDARARHMLRAMTDAADPSIVIHDEFDLQRQMRGKVYDPPDPAEVDTWVVGASPVRVDLPSASITLHVGTRVVAGSYAIDGLDLFTLFEQRVPWERPS